jgi:TrmH family RNA methyltransferase
MTGASHSSVKRYRDLARNPPRDERNRELLLDGVHLLAEAHSSGLTIDHAAFSHDALSNPSLRRLAERLQAGGTTVLIVSERTLASMSPVKTPSGVVGIAHCNVSTLEDVLAPANALVVVAHDVQDPGNVGAIVRTAEAAGATAVVSSRQTADPLGWKALRGSMGSALRLPSARADVDETLQVLRRRRISTVALAPRGGRPLFDADLKGPVALVVGAEGSGLPKDVLAQMDQLISIPMRKPVESLNVGVATALVLYEAVRQRQTHRDRS